MRFMWGDYDAGECVHGEPGVSCRTCHPQREDYDGPWLLLLGALVFMAWVFLAPAATRREYANDEAQARRHRERVERMAPKPYPYVIESQVFDLQQFTEPEVR